MSNLKEARLQVLVASGVFVFLLMSWYVTNEFVSAKSYEGNTVEIIDKYTVLEIKTDGFVYDDPSIQERTFKYYLKVLNANDKDSILEVNKFDYEGCVIGDLFETSKGVEE